MIALVRANADAFRKYMYVAIKSVSPEDVFCMVPCVIYHH